tara:strand:- start:251 stop:385 length:135 start_codon:yes stop_codon:yes gene_type:complete
MKASDMLVLTNMLSKILSDVDDLKMLIKKQSFKNFENNYNGEDE